MLGSKGGANPPPPFLPESPPCPCSDYGHHTRSAATAVGAGGRSVGSRFHIACQDPTLAAAAAGGGAIGAGTGAGRGTEAEDREGGRNTGAVDEVWYSQDPYTLGNRYRVRGSPAAQPTEEDGNGNPSASLSFAAPAPAPVSAAVGGASTVTSLYVAMNSGNHVATQQDLAVMLLPLLSLIICLFLLIFVSRYNSWYITFLRTCGLDTRADETNGSTGVELLFRVLQLSIAPVLAASFVTVAALSNSVYLPLGQLLAVPLSWCGKGSGSGSGSGVTSAAAATAHSARNIQKSKSSGGSVGSVGSWNRALQHLRIYLLPLSWLLRNPLFMLLSSGKLMYRYACVCVRMCVCVHVSILV